jgi:dTDP-4-amino-4,6-dideoxygalactose transaminase
MSRIRLMKPYITFEEVEEDFRDVFESGMFTRGENVEAFRKEVANYTGAKHAFLTTSATTALWTCLKLLNIGPGDEVIVSDFSFPASANVVEDLGAKPVFADVNLATFNMLPDELERKITANTKAVMFVDALGNPTGLAAIKAICDKYEIPLIEDAACAMGSSENKCRCGGVAGFTCFSFHPRKLISAGEGGAITTSRDDWAEWLEIKLGHGASGMKGVALDFIDYGYNFRMSELQAIMGSKQLAKLDKIVDERNAIRQTYIEQLEPLGYRIQQLGRTVRHNVQSLVFRVPENVSRDELISYLRANQIESTIGTYSLSATTYYQSRYADIQPNSSRLNDNTITLPCYNGVDVKRVVDIIGSF